MYAIVLMLYCSAYPFFISLCCWFHAMNNRWLYASLVHYTLFYDCSFHTASSLFLMKQLHNALNLIEPYHVGQRHLVLKSSHFFGSIFSPYYPPPSPPESAIYHWIIAFLGLNKNRGVRGHHYCPPFSPRLSFCAL